MLMNEEKLPPILRLIISKISSFIKFGGLFALFPSNEIWTNVMFLIWSARKKEKCYNVQEYNRLQNHIPNDTAMTHCLSYSLKYTWTIFYVHSVFIKVSLLIY